VSCSNEDDSRNAAAPQPQRQPKVHSVRLTNAAHVELALSSSLNWPILTTIKAAILTVLPVLLLAVSAAAQTNLPASATNSSGAKSSPPIEMREELRARCIEGRRSLCGKILRIFPGGILVESGYTNLLRAPLTKSWLVPGAVVASPAPGLVESKEPGAICVGTVFLTDLPRGKPHLYDYVVICGYPTGDFTYSSVGTIKKTVRRFSANVDKAVKTILAAAPAPAASSNGF
jgi:hypothetical protein